MALAPGLRASSRLAPGPPTAALCLAARAAAAPSKRLSRRAATSTTTTTRRLYSAAPDKRSSTTPPPAAAAAAAAPPVPQPQQPQSSPYRLTPIIMPGSQPPAAAPAAAGGAALQTFPPTLNPPASTRPPPLAVPERDPDGSRFAYWFSVGKAYMAFYKAGLRAVVMTNRKLVRALPPSPSPSPDAAAAPQQTQATTACRADALLRARTRTDLARLPIFGLIILVCGEFTPLVVVLVAPRLTPLACRIPRQVDLIRRRAEARRSASLKALHAKLREAAATSASEQQQQPDEKTAAAARDNLLRTLAPAHVCRALDLGSPLWDRLGLDVPGAGRRAAAALRALARDDEAIRSDASGRGVSGLEDDEVALACEARGMDVRGADPDELRIALAFWIDATTGPRAARDGEDGRVRAAERMLCGLEPWV